MENNEKIKVKRIPKRGIYEKEKIYELLDKEFFCHVGFIHNNFPVVIPTMFGRSGDEIYIHGASVSRMLTELEKGVDLCISVANVSGIVLARSAFNHSLNYESVVIFGKAELVEEDKKEAALKVISDHMLPGRWEETRSPVAKELKATKVLRIKLDEVSAKVREGHPVDEKEDYASDYWAGVLPVVKSYGQALPDCQLREGIEVPASIKSKLNENN